MRDPTHTTERKVICIHAYVHADIPNTSTRACLARIPTFIPVHNAIVYTMPHYYALMRVGYVLHSLECLKRGVVGKCCSNVLRSLRAYGVVHEAVRKCVCERAIQHTCEAHDVRTPYIQPRARSYTSTGTCTLTYQTQTRVYGLDETTRISCCSLTDTQEATHLLKLDVALRLTKKFF
jgi:hypothetical protein